MRIPKGVALLEPSTRVVEAAELHGDASADTEKWSECAFVKGKRAFVFPDMSCTAEGALILFGGLKSDFDDIEWLSWDKSAAKENDRAFDLH